MLRPNALKVTMLFPIYANDDTPFPPELWDWWLTSIVAVGAYHEFFTRGTWEGRLEYHRCDDGARDRRYLRQARGEFGQDVMYFEATQVHFKLI